MRTRYPQPVARVFSQVFRVVAAGGVALIAAHCGDSRSPTSPASIPTSKGAPVVRSITVDRQKVEAGQFVVASAQVDDPDTQTGGLRYEWSVTPSSGIIDGTGATGRWHSPANERVPGTYTLTVTVIKPYIGVDSTGRPANLEYRVTGSSAPITVNDGEREMKANSETFLSDFMNASVVPEMCVRNFADSCGGRQNALQQIASSREGYSGATVTYQFSEFQLGNSGTCTAPDGSPRCALMIYNVEWVRTRLSDGTQERMAGTEYLTGVYDRNRWWLCTSRFAPQ